MAIMTLIGFVFILSQNGGELFDPAEEDLQLAQSMAFYILASAQIFHVAAIHAGHASFLQVPVWKNRLLFFACVFTLVLQVAAIYVPFMQDLLRTTDLPLPELILGLILASSILPAVEVEKAIWRRREAQQQAEMMESA
jgi:Ca2+-transporting ATPase